MQTKRYKWIELCDSGYVHLHSYHIAFVIPAFPPMYNGEFESF